MRSSGSVAVRAAVAMLGGTSLIPSAAIASGFQLQEQSASGRDSVAVEAQTLIPWGLISLPKINQIQALFMACLPHACPLRPKPPESLDARWVTETELAGLEMWDPATGFDAGPVFRNLQLSGFDFYQLTELFSRRFVINRTPTYLERVFR
jgi:hypothetical protein